MLAATLAKIIRDKVQDATKGRSGTKLESRFIFHGPPLELLTLVYEELATQGGIEVAGSEDGHLVTIPVLLQLPLSQSSGTNPGIGESGICDESHLLHIRNDPHCPSFVALVPPGQHNNRSVASTTEEFGISPTMNAGHMTFDQWWDDGFVQELFTKGLRNAGIDEGSLLADALQLVQHAASGIDEVDEGKVVRRATWRLLSRIYSIPGSRASGIHGTPETLLSLACGVPPMGEGGLSSKSQISLLGKVADVMADGFKTGVAKLKADATDEVCAALDDFLLHVQASCEVPTMFERATEAFYLPNHGLEISPPPQWWSTLTTDCWSELLSEEPDAPTGDLMIECQNAVLPVQKGLPAIVKDIVRLAITTTTESADVVEVQLTGGSFGKTPQVVRLDKSQPIEETPAGIQKSPTTYKVTAAGHKTATLKVISLASWAAGLVVTSRLARKLTPPRKPKRSHSGSEWETYLSLPGSGRYELVILTSPGTELIGAEGIPDSATEVDEERKELSLQETRPCEYLVEVEADGKYQLDITFKAEGKDSPETCRAFISCEEVKEEGCRSEFERLIKLNRRHLEKLDTKAVIQLDRNARASSLQSWMLDEQNIDRSFRPVVIAEDYASCWKTPDWDNKNATGPILSRGRFLHDPRPNADLLVPPSGFVEARRKIAERIRETDDQSGLVESAPLGLWLSRDNSFRELVEAYLESYMAWLASDRDVACWVDVLAVCPLEADGRTLSRVPEAIMLSPLHPLRLAWHCLAQNVMHSEVEGDDPRPCPAVSILDPDCVPDLLTLSVQAPGGVDKINFLSVECNSDYWSVLWNGHLLRQLAERTRKPPFDSIFGIKIGGISSGFSPAQVARALEDVSDLLAAKPVISLVVSSAGGTTDACNEGLASWCSRRFGNGENATPLQSVGPRVLEIFDTRPASSRPDQAAIANLSEDTGNKVKWFDKQPDGTQPDLGIIAQLDSAQPESTEVGIRSPLGIGGLIRHRVRRQLHGAFLSESRQGALPHPFGEALADKVSACIVALESGQDGKVGLQFAPSVHSVSTMLEDSNAGFVAVSSTAIDPACFLAGWIRGTYLWDYDLPSYSHRAGDTSGYYLLSQVKEADRDALRRILVQLPECNALSSEQGEQILLEVARRGIPTVRGLSGDDTGATGDLGLFLAVRLLQDQFRTKENIDSLLPVLSGSADDVTIALIIPIDPFRGYLADLARSLSKEKKDASLSRPDLLVVGIQLANGRTKIRLTPIEVKCRQGSIFNSADALDALSQATTLSLLFRSLEERASKSVAWRLAYQHLLLSMIGFGLRVYSQHHLASDQASRWATYHEQIAAAVLDPASFVSVDQAGRLIVIDASPQSGAYDRDGDGFAETIVISSKDAGRIVAGDAKAFYDAVKTKVGTWKLFPDSVETAHVENPSEQVTHEPISLGESNSSSPQESAPVKVMKDPLNEAQHPAESTVSAESALVHSEDLHVDAVDIENSKGIVVSVGQTVDGFEPRSLTLNVSDTRLNQLNIGVVGDLGTGKTQFLKSLIMQISASMADNRGIKPRFLIFDYKRDYSSPDFVKATGARVVKPTRLPLNLFDTSGIGESAAPWLDRFRFFADVLDKVYSGIGPVQRDKLKGAVKNAYEACRAMGRQPTIYDIHHEYRELLSGKSDSPMAIIDDLVDMEIFSREPESTRPFSEFLDGVVVVSLDALGQDDRSKNMLVAIMLNMFYENMLKTPKRPFQGSDPQLRAIDSYLLVDEADNIMRYEFDVLRKLLLQGREFGAGVILASQYLRHFKAGATDYREPLLTWFIHKVPNVTPSELGALGFTSDLGELSERVKTLPNHHCLYKSFDVSGEVIRGLPFYEIVQQNL